MKTKIALLGGAFNPITKGHMQAALFVLNSSFSFDEIWLMPCYSHAYQKKMVSPVHRLAMCSLSTLNNVRIKVFDYEIRQKYEGGTYYIIKKLLEDKSFINFYDFSIIIGLDNANTFDMWIEHEKLKRLIRFVVVPRQGTEIDHKINWYLNPPHIYLAAENPIMKVSSTQVRNLLKSGDFTAVKDFLDHTVLDYIGRHNLYKE